MVTEPFDGLNHYLKSARVRMTLALTAICKGTKRSEKYIGLTTDFFLRSLNIVSV